MDKLCVKIELKISLLYSIIIHPHIQTKHPDTFTRDEIT